MNGMDDAAKEIFVAKVDAFAATLEPEEQSMLVELFVGDDEVSGFKFITGWPGLATLGFADVGQGDGFRLSMGDLPDKRISIGDLPEGR